MLMSRPPRRASATERIAGAARNFVEKNGWLFVWAAISAASIWLFSRSLFGAGSLPVILSVALVPAFWVATLAIPEDHAARHFLHAGALMLVPFMAIFAIMHAITGVTWLAWVASPVLVVFMWRAFMDIAEAEMD